MKADGSIIIDTKINDDGLIKGFEAIKSGMDSIADKAEKTNQEIQAALSGASSGNAGADVQELGKSLDTVTDNAKEAEKALDDMIRKAAESNNSGSTVLTGPIRGSEAMTGYQQYDAAEIAKSAAEYASKMQTAEQHTSELLAALQAAQQKVADLKAQGFFWDDEEYQQAERELARIKEDIKGIKQDTIGGEAVANPFGLDTIAGKVREAELEVQRLVAAGKGLGNEDYDRAYTKLARLRSEARAYAQELANGSPRAKAVSDVLSAMVSKGKQLAATLGKAVSSGIQKLGSTLKSAASGIGKLITGGKSVKQSFGGALSAVKRLAPALLAARGIMGILRKAVSAYMEQNQELSQKLSNAWTGLGNLLGPIITKMVNLVASAVAYFTKFLSLLGLTGKTASSQISSAGSAAGKETKKLQRQLASFDELNILNSKEDNSSGGGSGGAAGYDMGDVKLPDFAQLMAEQIKAGKWGEAATTLTSALNDMVASVDWAGIGAKIATALDGAMEFLATSLKTFDWYSLGASLGTSINSIITGVDWTNLGTILGAKFFILIQGLGGLFATIDWAALGQSLSDAFMGMWNSIDWAQAAKTVSDGVTGTLTTISTAIKSTDWQKLGNDVAVFVAGIDWNGVSDSLFEGVGAALGGLTAFLWGLIKDAWASVVAWWKENAYEDGKFTMQGLLDGIWEGIKDIGRWIKQHIFDPFIKGFKDAFGIHSPSTVMREQGGYIIAGLLNGITSAWASVKQWISNALESIKRVFTNAWNSLKTTTANIWKGIANAVKGPINGIIGFINGMISGIVSGVNAVIGVLNSLHFSIPKWVPALGGKSFGFNIGYLSAPRVPMLAQGAVLPPNQPFLAMVGDQKHGTNIEAPLETIQEAVALVMDDMIASNTAGQEAMLSVLREILSAVLGIQIGDDVLAQAVERSQRKMAILRGGRA